LSRPAYGISKDIGAISVLIGHLLKGVFIFLGRKARTDGIPKAIQFANWLDNQTVILIRKSNEVGKPRVIEVAQTSKGLLIFVARNLKAKGVPMVIWIAQSTNDLSSLFYRKAKIIVGEKVNAVRQLIATEQNEASAAAAISPSPEIIIKDEETISLNERLAQQIIQSEIECNAMIDIGSHEIEQQPCYSFLFAMSPTIVTNRGCIRLDGNGRRNIDFIQIIQKN
jgi:lysophospholipase L1-like esterase